MGVPNYFAIKTSQTFLFAPISFPSKMTILHDRQVESIIEPKCRLSRTKKCGKIIFSQLRLSDSI